MKFLVVILPVESVDAFPTCDDFDMALAYDAMTEIKRREKLNLNRIAPWELRIDHYRIFYNAEDAPIIRVTAIGYKDHNDLYIQGRKIEL